MAWSKGVTVNMEKWKDSGILEVKLTGMVSGLVKGYKEVDCSLCLAVLQILGPLTAYGIFGRELNL